MTAQTHIDAIGASVVRLERLNRQLRRLTREMSAELATHHALLDKAQSAYCATQLTGTVVAFSGGTNKPPESSDPDAPVGPPFGGPRP
jgi:hypothetical protein